MLHLSLDDSGLTYGKLVAASLSASGELVHHHSPIK